MLIDSATVFGKGALNCECLVIDKNGNTYGGGKNGIVYKADPDGNVREFCTLPAGSVPSGVTMDRQGNIIYCDGGTHAVMRVSQAGKVGLIADHAGNLWLTTPNFATYDSDGNLFVSNSTSYITTAVAMERGEFQNPAPNGALVRIRPNGSGELVAADLCYANGTAIDPKEEAVFVLESTKRDCLRIPLKKDGTFGKPEVYADNFPGIPDGMAFAADGTLFVTVPVVMQPTPRFINKILKIEQNGKWSIFLDGEGSDKMNMPTNCAFGGPDRRDLFIANTQADHFTRVSTSYVGHPLYHQR
jgi:gluconolactonase